MITGELNYWHGNSKGITHNNLSNVWGGGIKLTHGCTIYWVSSYLLQVSEHTHRSSQLRI